MRMYICIYACAGEGGRPVQQAGGWRQRRRRKAPEAHTVPACMHTCSHTPAYVHTYMHAHSGGGGKCQRLTLRMHMHMYVWHTGKKDKGGGGVLQRASDRKVIEQAQLPELWQLTVRSVTTPLPALTLTLTLTSPHPHLSPLTSHLSPLTSHPHPHPSPITPCPVPRVPCPSPSHVPMVSPLQLNGPEDMCIWHLPCSSMSLRTCAYGISPAAQ